MIWLQLTSTKKYQRMNLRQPIKTKKQMHLQIKVYNEHLKHMKFEKYQKTRTALLGRETKQNTTTLW